MGVSLRLSLNKLGFTLVEMSIVLIIVGLLLGTGASLMGILVKRAKMLETREIVNKAYEAVTGFVANNKRLPSLEEFKAFGVKTTDSQNNNIIYALADNINLCTNTLSLLTVTDSSSGSPQSKNNVGFIIYALGENLCDDTNATSKNFNVKNPATQVTCNSRQTDYDDIVRYADINQLRQNNCNPFRIVTDSLPTGTEEYVYPSTNLEATDGVYPYEWTLISGNLPPGLLLSGPVISGVPTNDGSYGFTIQARDSENPARVATKTFAITVNPNKPRITTEFISYGIVGDALPSITLSATGGKTPYKNWHIISGGLPPSLTLNSSTGKISGTPSAAGTYSFMVMVGDSDNDNATKTLSLTINPK
jgi:prepilin-type N-terminal cleavage/methylation domain-containing protein